MAYFEERLRTQQYRIRGIQIDAQGSEESSSERQADIRANKTYTESIGE